MQLQLVAFIASVVGVLSSLHGQIPLDRRTLINEVQSFQSNAWGKSISVKCSCEISFRDGGRLVSYRKPASFQFDRSRLFSSQYLPGDDDDFFRNDLGFDGKSSVTVCWKNDHPVSATRNSRKPVTLEVLDPNLVSGTCIAYGHYPPLDKWLKRSQDESFLEAFIREADSVQQQVDDVVATKRVDKQLHSIILKRKPMVHCVEYRGERRLASSATTEIIRMDYSLDKGFPQLTRTFRSVRTNRAASQDSNGIELVTATATIERLEFLDNVSDRDFLPDIPEGIPVTELQP